MLVNDLLPRPDLEHSGVHVSMTCSILWLCGLHTSGIGCNCHVRCHKLANGTGRTDEDPQDISLHDISCMFHMEWTCMVMSDMSCQKLMTCALAVMECRGHARLYHLILAVEVDAKPTNNDVFHGLARHMHFHVILRTLHVSVSNNWNLKLDTNLSPHCLGTFTSCTELRGPLEQQSTH